MRCRSSASTAVLLPPPPPTPRRRRRRPLLFPCLPLSFVPTRATPARTLAHIKILFFSACKAHRLPCLTGVSLTPPFVPSLCLRPSPSPFILPYNRHSFSLATSAMYLPSAIPPPPPPARRMRARVRACVRASRWPIAKFDGAPTSRRARGVDNERRRRADVDDSGRCQARPADRPTDQPTDLSFSPPTALSSLTRSLACCLSVSA